MTAATADTADVVVVGAGLAGLACARELQASGLEVAVLEAEDAVGGRVRTDRVDGFTLDRGFQVLNTAYPALRGVVDLAALDLRAFAQTVALQLDGSRVEIGNPLRRPDTIGSALRLPVGAIGKTALGVYAALCASLPTSSLKTREETSAAQAWSRARIPGSVVEEVLKPFLSGVLLETEMSSSRRFTDLMMRMFARGSSTVPALGMQQLPRLIAGALTEPVRLSTPVRVLANGGVLTDDGPVTARAVVVATDGWSAAGLVPGVTAPEPRGVTTVYHAADPWPEASAMLLLDEAGSPVANSIAISQAAPEYAPAGRVLVSTSLVHRRPDGGPGVDPDGPEVRAVLARLHRAPTDAWEHVATYDLPHALPGMRAPHPLTSPVRVRDGVYVAGDHRDTSSIQGALVSGHRAARAVAHDLLDGPLDGPVHDRGAA